MVFGAIGCSIPKPAARVPEIAVAKIRDELQDTMDANASVYRTEATLKQAEVDIAGLKERYLRVGVADRGKRYNTELLEAVELGFLLELAEVLVVGALERKESRGGHARGGQGRVDGADKGVRVGPVGDHVRLHRPESVPRVAHVCTGMSHPRHFGER